MPSERKAYPEVRTMHVQPFDHYTVAAGRREQIQEGRLVLLNNPCSCREHPSPLATDMIARVSQLSREPGTWHGVNWGAAGAVSLEAQAYEEAVNILGTYIRRLEDTARHYAVHLRDEHGQK